MGASRLAIVCREPPDSVVESAAPDDLRFVTLDCPLERWRDLNVRAVFDEMVYLKKLGFGAQHAAGVMPVDTTDFIGSHVLSCIDAADGLHVAAAFRVISCERCRAFNMTFSAEALALQAEARTHAAAVREFVGGDARVGYVGSWTVHPSVHANVPLRAALHDDFTLGALLALQDAGIPRLVVGATLRFKVDRLLSAVGFLPLAHEGVPLPPIAVRHLRGEPVLLMCRDEAEAPQGMEALHGRWSARVAL